MRSQGAKLFDLVCEARGEFDYAFVVLGPLRVRLLVMDVNRVAKRMPRMPWRRREKLLQSGERVPVTDDDKA